MRLARSTTLTALLVAVAACSNAVPHEEPLSAPPTPPAPETTTPAPPTEEALDATDLAAFDHLSRAVRTSKVASDEIFVEPANGQRYELHKLPVYWVRRSETGANERGYLVGFPWPQGKKIEHAALVELGPVHRWDKDVGVLPPDAPFGFAEPVAGIEAFVFPYRPKSEDEWDPALPSSPEFFAMLVHEAFHRYQTEEGGWIDPPGWTQEEASYPLTRDNIALALLENRVLIAGLEATDVSGKENALKTLAAIRSTRAKLPDAVVGGVNFVERLDGPQELVEGTADYAELHFREEAGEMTRAKANGWRAERLEMQFEPDFYETEDDVRMELAFGRFYPSGSTLGQLLDDVGGVDWRSPCKHGVSQVATITTKYPTAITTDAEALLTTAKTAHAYDAKILPFVDKLLALPKGAPRKLHRAKQPKSCRHH